MRPFLLILISILVLGPFGSIKLKAQKINPETFENKAQAYAILSAQYSKDAYFFARKNYYLRSVKAIKTNADSAIVACQEALTFTQKALEIACDSCEEGILRMKIAQQEQLLAIKQFKRVKSAGPTTILAYSEPAMYTTGNALNDAYHASLLMDGSTKISNATEETPLTEKTTTEESNRPVTRLESDETTYMTVNEIYGQRLVGIEDELAALNAQKAKATPKEKMEIEAAIQELSLIHI